MGVFTKSKGLVGKVAEAEAAGDHYIIHDEFGLDQDIINGLWRRGWELKQVFQNNHSMGRGNQARGKYTLLFERMAA